jgi:hypothetical protein
MIAEADEAATPLTQEERNGLIPTHITLRHELNELEQRNIAEADRWSFSRRRKVLDEPFLRNLHRRMLNKVWRWAGQYRTTERNLGIASSTASSLSCGKSSTMSNIALITNPIHLTSWPRASIIASSSCTPFPTAMVVGRGLLAICLWFSKVVNVSPGGESIYRLRATSGVLISTPCTPRTVMICGHLLTSRGHSRRRSLLLGLYNGVSNLRLAQRTFQLVNQRLIPNTDSRRTRPQRRVNHKALRVGLTFMGRRLGGRHPTVALGIRLCRHRRCGEA